MRSSFTDFQRDAKALPRVDVVIAQTRSADDPWLQAAIRSVEQQQYPNTGLWTVDNQDRTLNIGEAWNIGVGASNAPLILLLREEDMLTADLVQTLVTFWELGQRDNPGLVHVTSLMTVLDEQSGRMGSAPMAHAGMFSRETLLAHPFDQAMSHRVAEHLLQRLHNSAKQSEPVTFGVAHHHGYIWRNHAFRIDRLNVQ